MGTLDWSEQPLAKYTRDFSDCGDKNYPYPYWQSTIIVLIPTRDWSDCKAWETGLAEVGGAEHVLLTTNRPQMGKSPGMDGLEERNATVSL